MVKKHGLGRGLQALMANGTAAAAPVAPPPVVTPPPVVVAPVIQAAETALASAASRGGVQQVSVSLIRRNTLQPRHTFEPNALTELTESVRVHGVLQPLLVRPEGEGYELIAGERRLRAAGEAGLTTVPVIVMAAADVDALEIALIENLQRQDLNIVEEAAGYRVLAERFGLTQELISQRVGKARATVANALRVLDLPDAVRQLLVTGALSAGHAKALVGIESPSEQLLLAQRVSQEGLSVRQLEKLCQKARQAPRKPRTSRSDIPPNHVTALSDRLHSFLGTSVRLSPSKTYANGKKGKGCIEVDFYSNDDLNRLLDLIGLPPD